MLDQVIPVVQWCGKKLDLFRRIVKIGKNQKLSCREKFLLKRLMANKHNLRPAVFKGVQSEFPGKTVETLTRTYEELCKKQE